MKPGARSTPADPPLHEDPDPASPGTPAASDFPVEADPGGVPRVETGDPAPASAGAPGSASEADFKDRWLRAEAEFQNYRKRAQRELEEARRTAEERVMLEMIGAIDDLERALASAREAQAPESWIQGVELVANRMNEYLARQGVTALAPVGEPFDPEFHEALLEVEAPPGVAPGSVVSVVLKGYRRGNRVLRAARVVVARRDAATQS